MENVGRTIYFLMVKLDNVTRMEGVLIIGFKLPALVVPNGAGAEMLMIIAIVIHVSIMQEAVSILILVQALLNR